jgi:sulfate-transporting ATPase
METYLQFALLGLGLSAIYALLGLGVVVVYRGSGILNFAHGALAMFGAYTYYELKTSGWAFIPGLLVAVAFTAILGALIQLLILKRLKRASALTRVIATLAVVTILEGVATLKYSGVTLFVPPSLPQTVVYIGHLGFPEDRLWLLGIAVLLTAVLWAVIRYTRIGLATVAIAENELAASTLGWSPDLVATTTWAVGAGIAGLAGVLVVPLTTLSVTNLPLLVIPAMAAALVGRFTSFPLTLLGALLMGTLESILSDKVSAPGWPEAVPLLVIAAVLILRGRALPLRSHVLERLPSIGSGRIRPLLVIPAVATVIFLCFVWFGANVNNVVIVTFSVGLLILSVVVVTGYAGQISLAQYALAGVGALIAGRLVAADHWPFAASIVVGVIATAAAGIVFALPALRTRGVNLAVVTLSLGLAVQDVVFNSNTYTGGANGTTVNGQHFLGINVDPIAHPENYAVLTALFFLAAALVVANIRRGRSGHRMIAVRANERAAASLGINVVSVKLYAFAVSAALAGLGGILLAFSQYVIEFSQYTPLASINTVIYAVVGGVGYVMGPIVGSTLASGGVGSLITQNLSIPDAWLLVVGGIGVVTILMQNPDGMVHKTINDLRKNRLTRAIRARRAATRGPVKPAPDPDALVGADAGLAQRSQRSAVLELSGVTVRFGGVTALSDVDLVVSTGEIVGLIGPNGAGKTTLIDAATGFVPTASGTLTLNGQRLDRRRPHQRARAGLGRSFQSLELFVDLSVRDNLHVASDVHNNGAYITDALYPKRTTLSPSARAAIADFGLAGLLDRNVDDLTFSERRLVAIARAVAAEPDILLLDEPAAGLDEIETRELSHLLRRLAKDRGFGILLVEHDMSIVMATCDRVVTLDFGCKIAEGTPAEIRSDPAVIAAYLGAVEEDGASQQAAPRSVTSL